MADFSGDLASTDDESMRLALAQAEVPALLPALVSALDDRALIPQHLRPDLTILMDPAAGLSPQQQAEARELAFGALERLREKSPRFT